MFKVYARNYHRYYTYFILALGIVREPTVWGFMESKYSCTRDIIGLARSGPVATHDLHAAQRRSRATPPASNRVCTLKPELQQSQ